MQRRMPRLRSKTCSDKKPRNGTARMSTGTRGFLSAYKVAAVAVTKAKKISTGSSTQKCQCLMIPLQTLLTRYSDGKTPEEVIKQILSIHAILPGQKPDKQFNIPSRANDAAPPYIQESAPTTAQVPTGQTAQPTEQAQTGELAQSMGQMHIGQTAQPAGQVYPVQSEATDVQSQPAAVPQYQQQSVGLPSTYDGTSTYEPLSKGSISSDPSNPPTIPYQKPVFQPQNISPEYQDKIEEELPKSKLLNSNPAPEPRRDDLLRRTDSETHEDDEFHDAVS
jgi:hypothetical protein